MDLTDHQWALIQPLLSAPAPPSAPRGRPPYPDRLILDAILWKVRTGLPWYKMPPHYPAWQTCYYHYRVLRDAGLLDQIYALLAQDLFPRLPFDLVGAYHLGLISFHCQGRRPRLRVDLQEDGTWETATLCLLLRVAAQKALASLSRSPS